MLLILALHTLGELCCCARRIGFQALERSQGKPVPPHQSCSLSHHQAGNTKTEAGCAWPRRTSCVGKLKPVRVSSQRNRYLCSGAKQVERGNLFLGANTGSGVGTPGPRGHFRPESQGSPNYPGSLLSAERAHQQLTVPRLAQRCALSHINRLQGSEHVDDERPWLAYACAQSACATLRLLTVRDVHRTDCWLAFPSLRTH